MISQSVLPQFPSAFESLRSVVRYSSYSSRSSINSTKSSESIPSFSQSPSRTASGWIPSLSATRALRQRSICLRYSHHRPGPCSGELPPSLLKVIDDLLNDFPKLLINLDRIVTMNSGDQIGALTDVNLVLVAPPHPSKISVDWSHRTTSSMAQIRSRGTIPTEKDCSRIEGATLFKKWWGQDLNLRPRGFEKACPNRQNNCFLQGIRQLYHAKSL